MHQNTRFSASRSSSNHDTVMLIIFNDLLLPFRKLLDDPCVHIGRSCTLNLFFASSEVLTHKGLKGEIEVVAHKLQGSIVVFHHVAGKLSHNVNLLSSVKVKLFKLAVLRPFVATVKAMVQTLDFHRMVKDQKAPFEF